MQDTPLSPTEPAIALEALASMLRSKAKPRSRHPFWRKMLALGRIAAAKRRARAKRATAR